jgi:hypothetical protein
MKGPGRRVTRWGDEPQNAITREHVRAGVDTLARKHSANYTKGQLLRAANLCERRYGPGNPHCLAMRPTEAPRRPTRRRTHGRLDTRSELIFRNVRGGVLHQDLLSANMRNAAKTAESHR